MTQLPLPNEVVSYIDNFRDHFSSDLLWKYIENLKSLRVLVIGEAIIDEYVYCDALGKSGKEPMLAMRYISKERFAGGILAVANHISDFCQQVTLASYLGNENPEEEFVRDHLKKNITPFFITKTQSPTIIKRRIIDQYTLSKILGLYEINDELLLEDEEDQFCQQLELLLPDCDLVIVTDYGHGLITPKIVDLLAKHSPFLAVNTQINASNIGFHTISRYPHADFVCIHEGELRMNYRSRSDNVEDLVLDLSKRLDCKSILITRGAHGTMTYTQDDGFSTCPAFAIKVVDRIGAGDAVFAICSLLAAQKAPSEVINFVGNMVGSQAVMVVGNQRSINKSQLFNAIGLLLG
jgi:rfaE bifunctional protein kinase chain/domain